MIEVAIDAMNHALELDGVEYRPTGQATGITEAESDTNPTAGD